MKRIIFVIGAFGLLALALVIGLQLTAATPTAAGNPETTWTAICASEVTSSFSSQYVTKFECPEWNLERFCDGKAIIAPWHYNAEEVAESDISALLSRFSRQAGGGVYVQCSGS